MSADGIAVPQAMPVGGQENVPAALIAKLQEHREVLGAEWADIAIGFIRERTAFGKRKYGQELMTFDGRSPHLDALQELVDLMQYLHKAEMQHARLVAENAGLRAKAAVLERDRDDERGTRQGLEERLARVVVLVPENLRNQAADVEQAVEMLGDAHIAASQAAFKCCSRAAWGDGEHVADCPKARLERELAAARENFLKAIEARDQAVIHAEAAEARALKAERMARREVAPDPDASPCDAIPDADCAARPRCVDGGGCPAFPKGFLLGRIS